MMKYDEFADYSLAGGVLAREQCLQVLACPDEDLPGLLDSVFRVRRKMFGKGVFVQVLSNAKSGMCPEDCHYCSQSIISKAPVEKYSMVPVDQLVKEAELAKSIGTSRFCIALSGRRPTDRELGRLCEAVLAIKEKTGLPVCCSLGILEDGQAERLKAAGLDRVNHNLNTSKRFHPEICTTHTYDDRVNTIHRCKAAGLEICSGGIIGQGETDEDIVDLFLSLRELRPEAVPVNFLVPIAGTPFEDRARELTPQRCLKVLCLARFLLPFCEVRAAGGREHHLRSLQPLAFYAVDSIFVSGYLTTEGQGIEEARRMIEDMNFEFILDGAEHPEAGRTGTIIPEVATEKRPGTSGFDDDSIRKELAGLEAGNIKRTLRTLPNSGGVFFLGKRRILNFSSNDYLNLSADKRLKTASIEAVNQVGCGSTASRLMSGHFQIHEKLEKELARFMGGEAALVFGSGFLTNIGVLTSLAGPDDAIFADELNHASLIDGARLSRAERFVYRHKDTGQLAQLLEENRDYPRKLIVTDSLFSMDGDIAPLRELMELARRYEALLVVDEAHAIGILGDSGNGVCRSLGLDMRSHILIGTFGKALGGYGGFAVCSEIMREYLINRSRTFYYSTGLPPACVGSALAALGVIRSEPNIGGRVLEKARALHSLLENAGFDMPPFESQILPVHIGSNGKTLEIARVLWERGILVTAIRPPTIPKGSARLRLSVTLAHTESDMERLVEELRRA